MHQIANRSCFWLCNLTHVGRCTVSRWKWDQPWEPPESSKHRQIHLAGFTVESYVQNRSGQCTVNTDRSAVPEHCLLFWSGGRLAGGRRLPNFTFTRERDGSGCCVFMSLCVWVGRTQSFFITYFSNIFRESRVNLFQRSLIANWLHSSKEQLMHKVFYHWKRQLACFCSVVTVARVLNSLNGFANMHEERRMQEHVPKFENWCFKQGTAASLGLSEQVNQCCSITGALAVTLNQED